MMNRMQFEYNFYLYGPKLPIVREKDYTIFRAINPSTMEFIDLSHEGAPIPFGFVLHKIVDQEKFKEAKDKKTEQNNHVTNTWNNYLRNEYADVPDDIFKACLDFVSLNYGSYDSDFLEQLDEAIDFAQTIRSLSKEK